MTDQAVAPGDVWTFDDFAEGAAIGSVEVTLDERRLALWHRVYALAGATPPPNEVPYSLLVAAMMECYLKVIPSRPPGNVHARQTLSFPDQPVAPGTRLRFDFACRAKELKRERRWVTLGVRAYDRDRAVLNGEIVTIWAQ